MGAIYQLIFFLAIALLAIAITVFVLAVSLLGRAVRMSVEEQEKVEKDRKEDNDKRLQEIQGELDRAKKKGIQPDIKRLDKILKGLKRKERIHLLKLWWIKRKPAFLRASWGALIPGAFFLIAIVLSVLALYWAHEASIASIYMWLAVAAMFFGICFVCLTLKVIESVAVTSEETAFSREVQRMKTALREFEEERKPELRLEFRDKQPPFSMVTESEESIKFGVGLSKGGIARKVEVAFFAPSGFKFPDSTSTRPAIFLPDYATTLIEVGDVSEPLVTPRSVKLKAPSKPKTYLVFYRLYCEGSYSDFDEFKVVVKKPKHPV